jgi:hypothetical protein
MDHPADCVSISEPCNGKVGKRAREVGVRKCRRRKENAGHAFIGEVDIHGLLSVLFSLLMLLLFPLV